MDAEADGPAQSQRPEDRMAVAVSAVHEGRYFRGGALSPPFICQFLKR